MLAKITPEGFDIVHAYLECENVADVAKILEIPEHKVVATLQRNDVKAYLDGIYLDMGYRNRNKLGKVLDRIIESKIEEAEESDMWTSKDLLEVLQFAHKMRLDELKLQKQEAGPTVNVANIGDMGNNHAKLLAKIMGQEEPSSKVHELENVTREK